jgi:succinyl-CoA synthetase beta subunit
LDDAMAKSLLRHFGVPLVPEVFATTSADAVCAATCLKYPVVLKGVVLGIAHKTELGLVALDLGTPEAVVHACSRMAERAGARLSGFLVQPMVSGGIELVIGVKVDPNVGPAVLLGLGGVFVEAYGPPVVEMAPVSTKTAASMIATLDRKRILNGYRTGRPLDVESVVATLTAVGHLAWALRDRIDTLDLNPVIVTADGALAVDAVISVRPTRDVPTG